MVQATVKPEMMSFKELIADIDAGILKIPAFQRDFDWDVDRTLRLLDSIAKRYPVGSFLVWDTDDRLGALRNIGGIDLPDVPDGKNVKYVLDGQQRITSLYAAYRGAEVNGQSYDVCADLDADPATEEIFHRHAPTSGKCVSLATIIGDDAHLVTPKLKAKHLARFHQVREAFREYQFPVVRVSHQPVDAVCEMFERVNSGGVKLDVFDIMVAKTWTPEFSLRERWDELEAKWRGIGFERLGSKAMLQALAAHFRGAVAEREIMKVTREEAASAWKHVEQCLAQAIDFLKQQTQLPGARFLSYPAVAVVLSHFFDKNGGKNPSRAQSRCLTEYYWRAGLTERYGSNPSSTLPADLKLMAAIADGSLDAALPVRAPVVLETILGMPLRTTVAACCSVLSLLAHSRPVSLVNGSEISLDNRNLARANSRHYHHIFPKKWLAQQGRKDGEADTIANIMLIPAQENLQISDRPPSNYMHNKAKHAGDDWQQWLNTHLITPKAAEAMMANDFGTFTRLRARAIAERANKLMGLTKEDIKRLTGQWAEG